MIELRAHHLLCTVLYQGKGYSEQFVHNMDNVVDALKNGHNQIKVVTRPDIICSECPNAMEDGSCALDGEKVNESADAKSIASLDENVFTFFELEPEKIYEVSEIFTIVQSKITPEFFNLCCGECRWHKMGLCDFEDYMIKLGRKIAQF